MRVLVFTCLFWILPALLHCQSQDPGLDSLKRPLPKDATPIEQAKRLQAILRYVFFSNEYEFGNFPAQLDSLNKCCIAGKTEDKKFERIVEADVTFYKGAAILYEYPSLAKSYFQSAICQYELPSDSVKLALVYMSCCSVASAEGDSLEFTEAYRHVFQLAPSVQDTFELASLYSVIGVSCFDFGRYAEAIQLYFNILELIDENPIQKMQEGKAIIYTNIASIYVRLSDYSNAKLYYDKAIKEASANKQDPAEFMAGLAGVLVEEKNYQSALEVLKSALPDSLTSTNSNLIAASTYLMATCYRNLGDMEKALPLARKGTELLPIQKHASYGSAALLELSNCEFELGMIDSSLVHALLAFRTFSNANNNTGSVESAELLIKIYRQKNDYRKAFEYSELRYKFQNLIERQQSTRQLAFGEFTRDNEVKNAKREAEVQAQLIRQRNIRYGLFAGLGMLSLLAFLLYNRFRFKQKTAEQLEAKNREVEAARERAERSEAFKSRFLANMSHEIRTPLHGIAGYTDLLLETSLTEKQRRYLNSVRHSNERLTEVVNDILDLSKLEAGEVRLRQVPFSPAQVAEDVREALSPRAESKGIALNLFIGENVPDAVLGDPTRLYQILMNLAGNAVKFTEKGEVKLTVGNTSQLTLSPSHRLTFSLSDTGIGIPSEKLATIFDSFQQAEGDTTARFGGTGLGLTIARELVQLHGSDIQVESEVGKGSTFSFTLALPLANAADLEQKPGVYGDLYFAQPLKILLADDNAFNREIATEALRRHFENVEIVEAENGKKAVELLGGIPHPSPKGQASLIPPFDLVLMDMQMPEMNGLEATRHIRQQFPEGKKDIPIIALTASATPSEIEQALASGMNRHLPKPFKPHELAAAIAATLGLRSNADKDFPGLQDQENHPAPFTPSQRDRHPSPLIPNNYDLIYLRDFCGGDEAQVWHFIEKFEQQCPLELERLEAALQSADRAAVYRAAHSLKPQLEFVGMKVAAVVAAKLEDGARNGNELDALEELFASLKAVLTPT